MISAKRGRNVAFHYLVEGALNRAYIMYTVQVSASRQCRESTGSGVGLRSAVDTHHCSVRKRSDNTTHSVVECYVEWCFLML